MSLLSVDNLTVDYRGASPGPRRRTWQSFCQALRSGAALGRSCPSVAPATLSAAAAAGWVRVVDGVSLRIERGQTVALVGESGCGKSSTVLALLALLPAGARAGGRLRLGDEAPRSLDETAMAELRGSRVAIVLQEAAAALSPVLTVGAQVAEPLRLHGRPRPTRRAAFRQAVELLGQVGIDDPERRARGYPHQLSGGMARRALLAMALAGRPEVLLCDEPTAGLDVTVQAQVLDHLDRLRRERGMGLLLCTHELAVAAERGDALAVMYAGQIVEQAEPAAEAFRRPAHPYTRALLDASPAVGEPAGGARPIAGTAPAPGRWPPGCRYAGRCPLRQARCTEEAPALRAIAPGRSVRCHLPLVSAAG